MDQQLLVGILLIIVGVAVGLIAVAVVMNRRTERGEGPARLDGSTELAEVRARRGLSRAEGPAEQPTGEEFIEAPQIEHALEPAIVHSREIPGEAEIDREPAPDTPDIVPETTPEKQVAERPLMLSGSPGRQLVAEIYREEVSGELVVKLADKEYRNLADIEDEQVREQLSSAASDLARWFAEDLQPSHSPSEQRAPAPPAGRSMLEGINSILQRSLATSGLRERGIRLVPDAAGGVKVLIGLKSYALDEVPDEEIRRLIRESVAEWEAGQ
ncbi:MAG: hypothetical protein AAB321_01160 [Chloroflexota bacterium]